MRGAFFYLYLVEDVWSRKIIGWAVHEVESADLAAALVEQIRREMPDRDLAGWVLHSDNGGPMKGATMLATLQRLGVVASFSRPSVSDDNAYAESLFLTMKYRAKYPLAGFATLDDARTWVRDFVAWYNDEHQHSGIGYVPPVARHAGEDIAILAASRTRPSGDDILNAGLATRDLGLVPRPSLSTQKSITPPTARLHPQPEFSRDNYLDSYRLHACSPTRGLLAGAAGQRQPWRRRQPARKPSTAIRSRENSQSARAASQLV